MTDFHFLRPLWLTLLLLLPLLYALRHRLNQQETGWQAHIPARLLKPLIPNREGWETHQPRRSPLMVLGLAWLILAIALAGPSWREAPTPLKQSEDSLVLVLDLSLSMLATDVQPDRLTRAKRKIRDILAARQDGLNALVVYSGDAHVVTPLTQDTRTIEALLDVLEPVIMPAQGNRADLAIKQAIDLLRQGAIGQGRILLLTDQVNDAYRERITRDLNATDYSLSTLVVGTREGGPMPLAQRGFIRDGEEIVIARAEPEGLASLADSTGGQSHALTLGNTDIQALKLTTRKTDEWTNAQDGLSANRWQDDGYWLLWLAAPLLLLAWRRGAFAILALALLPMALTPRPAQALDWAGLWQREDQRAPELIEQDPETAARQLQQPGWRGAALYRDGQYESAAKTFAKQPGAIGHYNRGNALARAGKLKQAISAYDQALQANPELEAARENRQLVKRALEQQQQQQQQQQKNGGNGNEGQQPSQQTEPDQKPEERAAKPSQSQEPDNEPGRGNQPAPLADDTLDQGQEQWLRRIPDNPGGLLQRKFLQQHEQRQTATDEGDTPW